MSHKNYRAIPKAIGKYQPAMIILKANNMWQKTK